MPRRLLSSILILAAAVAAQADQVVISEIMYHPRAGWPEFVEVFNNTVTVFDVAGWKLSGGVQYEFPDFSLTDPSASLLHSFERIVLSEAGPEATRAAYHLPETTRVFGPWKGKLKNGDERITLRDQNGTRVTTVRYADRGLWSPAADGTGHSLVLQDPNGSVDDWRNWRASERPGGTPGLAPVPLRETPAASPEIEVPQGTTLLAYSATWRFDDRGTNQDPRWREPDFDDSAWAHGPGVLGFGKLQDVDATLKTVVRSNRQFTYYFRTTFQLPPLEATERIVLDFLVDDGAVFYLNGREAGRVRMPAGVITNRTPASVNVRHVQEEINGLTLEPPLLVPGTNVLAVEVHQDRVTSSDLFLAARVRVYSPWRTNLVINEIAGAGTGEGFVELFNPGRDPVPLRGWYFTDDARALTKTKFGRELVVPPGGLTAIPFGEVRLGRTNRVTVHLVAPDGKTVVNSARASFADDLRPVGRKPAGGRAWFQFPEPTPNAPNRSADTAVGLRLNEVHFGGDGIDWVEVINSTEDTVSLRGLFLASKRDLSDRTPLETGLAELASKGLASGGVKFPIHQGEARIYLVDAAGVVLDGAVWSVSAGGESRQAFPDGSGEWYVASVPSRDRTNQPARNTQVILNEIFYDPPALLTNVPQFIELFNRGASAVDLSRWRLTEGVEFLVPSGTTIAPGGFLVIASSAARLRQIHGDIPVLGDFQGRLRGRGERVRLVDALGNLVNEVDFRAGGDWPLLAHRGGSSLELIHPDLDNARASAWRDSLEENKSSWREYSFSDTYAELSTFGQPTDYRELHLHLVGDGHLALRRIGLWRDGTNWLEHADRLAADGSSASGWLAQGNHAATFMTNGELHIVADGHGDNRPNRLEIDCLGLRKGRKYELKFEARWISGLPRLIAQTFDHSFAHSFAIDVPPNLGTPGRTNSVTRPAPRYAPPELAGRRIDSAPPQLDQLLHAPAVPRSTNTVRITVSVASVAPLQSVQLMHRADTAAGDGEWRSTLMEDDGRSSGDAAAGDGTYTAELTEYQTNGALVQFYVQAATSAGVTAVLPRRGAEAPAMFIVDDKRVLRDLRVDRFLVSAYDVGSIANGNTEKYGFRHPRHSNHYYNMTYIFNEQEVFYSGEMRISGSPWTRGDHLGKGKWKLPDDRPFRDHTKFYYDNDNSYHNRVARYLLYRMGHVVNEGEWIRVIVNQGGASLKEDTEPIGNDFLDRTFKRGSEGELYRIDDEWWFQDNWERTSRDADWSYKGSDNPGRYRTEWMKRTREAEDDFTALIGLFRTYSENRYTQDEIEKLLDPDAILRLAVVRGYISDWDSFTMGRGKNSYLYRRPEDGRFQFFQWDSDLAYNDPNSAFYSGRIQNWIEKPWNKHLFNYYLAELIQVTESPRTTAWLEAEENASASFNVNTNFYLDYFAKRNVTARRTLGRELDRGFALGTNFVAGFTTTNETITLSGTAPCTALDIRLADHPGARVRWKTEFAWNFPKVPLRPGENRFRVTAVHGSGRVLGEATATVTRTAP